MKRIFLTSGLVLCMACPAFADPTATFGGATSGSSTCTQPQLGTYSGPATLKAIWATAYTTMTLNENDGDTTQYGGSDSTTAGDTTAPELYLVKDADDNYDGVYRQTGTATDGTPQFTQVATDGAGVALTSTPKGITVTYTFNGNTPSGRQSADITNMPTNATSPEREFQGYYAYGTTTETYSSATPYIDEDGKLTVGGAAAANDYNNAQPWIAMYEKVSPVVTWGATNNGIPQLAGYTFKGWSTNQNADVTGTYKTNSTVDSDEIGEDTTLYAIWQANNILITFDCNCPEGATTCNSISADPADVEIAMDQSGNINETCSLNGYTFGGWTCGAGLYTDSAATTAKTTFTALEMEANSGAGTAVYMKSSTTVQCQAIWTPKTITPITWNDNGATTAHSGGDTSCTYDAGVALPTAPSRTGYTFGGWEVVQ